MKTTVNENSISYVILVNLCTVHQIAYSGLYRRTVCYNVKFYIDLEHAGEYCSRMQ
jgi:hypothetical protein